VSGTILRKKPVRVFVVEDSAVIRRLLAHIIAADPRLVLAGEASSAEEALELIPSLRPDVISMDIRLPGMDGLEATRRIMEVHPTPIVVIADAVEDSSLRISMNALRSGALAVVEKPPGLLSHGFVSVAQTIATQLAIMSEVPVIRRRARIADPVQKPAQPLGEPRGVAPEIVGIAASTGGPPALARLLGALPATFPLPVLLVQHMGAPFLEGFASWLDGLVPLSVRLAREGETPQPGQVLVAPGERHLCLARRGTSVERGTPSVRLENGPPVSSQKPSATELFASLAVASGPRGLGVLLTGMGEDGARGLLAMRESGAFTITEHESTAVVDGMPGAARRLGASSASLPLDLIAPRLLQLAGVDAAA